jgi:hypothetical protein
MAVALSYRIPGNIIEFGVFKGESTRCIRRAATRQQRRFGPRGWKEIYACDSFEGLQEKFENVEVGGLAAEAPRISGVNIVKGYFEDTLTDELAARVGTVALASLDADLYSSTLCALNWLTPLLRSGSLFLFDEFIGENQSEKRAFEEWMAQTGMTAVMIADFLREPAGRGENLDRRVLFQVVTENELTAISPLPRTGAILKQQLQRAPSVYRAASRLRRLLRR